MSRLQFLIRPALALLLVASAVGVVAAACGDNNEEATPKATATKAAATGTAKASPTKAATATPKATATP